MWTTDGGDNDVGPPANFRDIPRARMNYRDCCIDAFSHKQKRHWFSDDHAATKHDDVGAGEGDSGFAKKAQTTQGGARNKPGVIFECELCDIERVKSVHIFARIERADNRRFVDLRRWRRLNQNAMNFLIAIQLINPREQLFLRRGSGQFQFHRMQAEFAAHFVFCPDVGARGGIIANQNHGQPRR